jgi:putative endonuclease
LTPPSNKIGADAESRAEQYLHSKGLKTIEKNYLCKVGEIDLIMKDEDSLIFVEVRFRKNNHFGSAAESVDYKKQTKIRKSAEHYLIYNRAYSRYAKRFDVVAITGSELSWLQGAF